MRIVSNKIIADSFLSKFSFCGQKQKKNFSVFGNVTKLIVLATMDAYNDYIAVDDKAVPKTEAEVLLYFKTQFIKYANQRSNQK